MKNIRLVSKSIYYILRNNIEDFIKLKMLRIIAWAIFCIGFITPRKMSRYNLWMLSHRVYPSSSVETFLINRKNVLLELSVPMIIPDKIIGDKVGKKRALILKAPRFDSRLHVVEKGVLLIKFSTTFKFYLQNIDCEKLLECFHIVLEPSWAGYCLPEIIGWTKYDQKIIIECSEVQDYEFIKKLNSNLIPVRFGSSDWVDHRVFYPKETNKIYDVIYISNYNSIKRNHAYLKAIKNIRIPNFKAALVCNSWGDCKDNVQTLIDFYGLSKSLDVFEALKQSELNDLLNKSKLNVLLSLKEGSNRSIFESMFSGIPAIVLKDNVGVNKEYINCSTGKLIDSRNLEAEIIDVSNNYLDYSPREWALENISTYATKRKLDEELKFLAEEEGLEWNMGTHLKVNIPEAHYFDDVLAGQYPSSEELCDVFDLKFNPDERLKMVSELFEKY
ncbi:glycosyltransferase [Saccharophagus degradans]|uniref:glycosyltransferase n=1 Tax=Saccharophagus degradans TaxID=86304 RepID=UPI001C09F428|nr:glycosyltransferase [Saccharophagus degradans]MBU2986848.1 glycosyltransferase [Saccharophagus degradans]